MAKHKVGFWLYENGGGLAIQKKFEEQLLERDIQVVSGLNLRDASASSGTILCNGVSMEELSLYFSYNAGQQTQYQVYLYDMVDRLIPVINNFSSFALTEDKFKTTHLLRQHNIRTPDYRLCHRNDLDSLRLAMREWGGRAVYKPTDGWGGIGIVRLDNEASLDMLQPFLHQLDVPHFFVERYIDNDNTDFRIDIVDGQYVGCYGRQAPKDHWKTNITSGGQVINREANDEVIDIALKAAAATGLEVAGVDLLYDREHEEYVVLEVNGIPAFATPEQEANGLDFNNRKIELIVDLIERLVQNPDQRNQPQFTTSSIENKNV